MKYFRVEVKWHGRRLTSAYVDRYIPTLPVEWKDVPGQYYFTEKGWSELGKHLLGNVLALEKDLQVSFTRLVDVPSHLVTDLDEYQVIIKDDCLLKKAKAFWGV